MGCRVRVIAFCFTYIGFAMTLHDSTECQRLDSGCTQIKELGYCNEYPHFGKHFCPETCCDWDTFKHSSRDDDDDSCDNDGSEETLRECEDSLDEGLCQLPVQSCEIRSPSVMNEVIRYCKKTCGYCSMKGNFSLGSTRYCEPYPSCCQSFTTRSPSDTGSSQSHHQTSGIMVIILVSVVLAVVVIGVVVCCGVICVCKCAKTKRLGQASTSDTSDAVSSNRPERTPHTSTILPISPTITNQVSTREANEAYSVHYIASSDPTSIRHHMPPPSYNEVQMPPPSYNEVMRCKENGFIEEQTAPSWGAYI